MINTTIVAGDIDENATLLSELHPQQQQQQQREPPPPVQTRANKSEANPPSYQDILKQMEDEERQEREYLARQAAEKEALLRQQQAAEAEALARAQQKATVQVRPKLKRADDESFFSKVADLYKKRTPIVVFCLIFALLYHAAKIRAMMPPSLLEYDTGRVNAKGMAVVAGITTFLYVVARIYLRDGTSC